MKIVIVVFALIAYCFALSKPVIENTKQTGTVGNRTGDYCGVNEHKIWPGETLNVPGQCRLFECRSNFNVYVTTCSFGIPANKKFINQDKTKLYPDCCGQLVPV
ncbi:hypothetical protein PVAND_003424 [Polypedilum vanderplanki]|uniref:Single domain-containing protein n=1 Tax=Polypedilum vanderplanki TaxID=319348 RepID=A0A9J6BTZ9_POLVA|nr:hypothetical protein PVAND_003424 [Polypedilum vanderplanki]